MKQKFSPALFFLLLAGSCLPFQVQAQAGPPLITNDPDTPGDGNWEINLAVSGAHSRAGWDLAAPDLDVNYGWGERIQLSVHLPWNHQRVDAGHWQSGAGPVEFALRWRFVDEERAGFAMAIQPHWARSWSSTAVAKGLAPANEEFALPLQVAKTFGKTTLGVELGRNFIRHESDEWQTGLFWARECGNGLQALAEVNTVWPAQSRPETVLNLGLRKPLNDRLLLLASLGRQLSVTPERRQFLFYVGVQILR